MPPDVDFKALKPDDDYRMPLPGGVWLIDDHKWALSVWAKHAGDKSNTLIHADQHWDAGDPFEGDEANALKFVQGGPNDVDRWIENGTIGYDTFIGPAIRLGLIEAVHFFCWQEDVDQGLSPETCERHGAVQANHWTLASLASIKLDGAILFDLCLDLFCGEAKYVGESGGRWADAEIQEFLDAMKQHIRAAKVVTVSLSFGYSGDEDDTRYLAEFVVPQIVAWRTT